MNLTLDPSKRFDLTVRYPKDGTATVTTVNQVELVANLTEIYQVPMLTALQHRGVVQMSGGPWLSWKPAEVQSSSTFQCAWSGEHRTGKFLLVTDHNDGVWVSQQAWDEFLNRSTGIVTFRVLNVRDAGELAAEAQS